MAAISAISRLAPPLAAAYVLIIPVVASAPFERGDMCAYCYTWVEKLEQQAQALIRDMKEALVALAPTFWDAWLAKGNAWEPHQVDDARWVHKLFPPPDVLPRQRQ